MIKKDESEKKKKKTKEREEEKDMMGVCIYMIQCLNGS
jgi:hypothetical protein